MREIVFDTETTGLDPDTGDRMVEIGCIELLHQVATGRVFHTYFNPDRAMPAEAEAVHGLSATFLSDKRRFHEHAEELLDFLGDAKLIAHNARFDFKFLNAELISCQREPVCLSRMIDTVEIAKKKHPGAKLSLDALCTRYGIDRSHRTRHGALLDAELLAQLYVELNGGRQIGLELAALEGSPNGPPSATGSLLPANGIKRIMRTARPHCASEEELVRHARFVANMIDPIWTRDSSIVDGRKRSSLPQ
ncbi:DNA polymerase III subunit epsilon [Croceicoccus sp. F390]|uniref:DNA polymerase III subunit epsilon n=1 Tax=Croceicoccus esteveae TaxID=3075597 RepID=A0ABU2ZHW9_9SPHN|nr:DNA polymerase III subunit epsilon [Croceicoccus sp. F390]MDT0576217.1 DNA polymerase III subunit epsilon [Croceicoccus sp. F390]